MGEFLYNTEVGSLRPKIYSNKNTSDYVETHLQFCMEKPISKVEKTKSKPEENIVTFHKRLISIIYK